MEDGIMLRDYAAALISKWWVVILVLVAATAAAIVISSQLPPQYQVRTQLLLVSRTSEKLTTIPNVGSALSVDTLSNLALANDLLENIVQTLSRDNPGSGNPASVEALAGMMKVAVQVSDKNKTTVLPLLTLTVQGKDPVLLKRIAETWADLFIQRNASLFADESARSFDYIQSQYDETRRDFQSKNQEKLAYLRQNPIDTMRGALNGQLGLFNQFFSELDRNRVVLVTTQAERKELERALESEPRILDESKVLIDDTRQALQAKNQERLAYLRQNPLDPMRSTLEVQLDVFKQFSGELDRNRVALVATQAERKELARTLESEPRILDESKVFINGVVVEKAINPLYVSIKEKLTDVAVKEAFLAANVAQLETRVEEQRASIAVLSARVAEIEAVESTYDTEVSALSNNFGLVVEKALNPLHVSIKEKLTDAATREAIMAANVAQLDKRVEEYRASITELSAKVDEIEVTESTFDREISVLTSNLQTLAAKLQEARLAREEQGGTIRVVESPIVPQVPVGPRRSQIFLPVGAIGLLVGIVAALMVHYLQNGTLRAGAAPAARKDT